MNPSSSIISLSESGTCIINVTAPVPNIKSVVYPDHILRSSWDISELFVFVFMIEIKTRPVNIPKHIIVITSKEERHSIGRIITDIRNIVIWYL